MFFDAQDANGEGRLVGLAPSQLAASYPNVSWLVAVSQSASPCTKPALMCCTMTTGTGHGLDNPASTVCNTGGPPGGDALGFTRDQWQTAYTTLVISPIAFVEAVMPGMRERGFGRVVNVVSAGVREPIPGLMLSNAHRISMINAFKTIVPQVARDGVTLNSVLPGRVDTDRLGELYGSREAAAKQAEQEVPTGRLGTVEEFAAVVAFLCSARASYVNGETIVVDGGLTRSVF